LFSTLKTTAFAPRASANETTAAIVNPEDPQSGGTFRSGSTAASVPPCDPNSFGFVVWQLKEDEDKMIAERLANLCSNAARSAY
jgi:hypothetical protein